MDTFVNLMKYSTTRRKQKLHKDRELLSHIRIVCEFTQNEKH